MLPAFFTIGVFGSTEDEFFEKLVKHGIDTFCDLRQRRGVRGSRYAFVNSTRLQKELAASSISYVYEKGLAPGDEERAIQKRADEARHQRNTQRDQLDPDFAEAYRQQVLDAFDLRAIIARLESSGAKRVALFCVEELPCACHRSLVAERLRSEYGCKVQDL